MQVCNHPAMPSLQPGQKMQPRICTADFGPFVNQLATQLSSLRRLYLLSAPPKPMTIEVRVDGVLITEDPKNGWSYVPAERAIRFNGTSIPRPGADIRITYDVQG